MYWDPPEKRRSIVRILAIVGAVIAALASASAAVMSYPLIVIADSDLGAGAMQRVHDCVALFFFSLAVFMVIMPILPWPRMRIVLATGVLTVLALWRFQSDSVPHAVRWPLMVLIATGIASEAIEGRWRGTVGGRRGLALTLLLVCLVVVCDYQGRLYFGLLPAKCEPLTARHPELRTSISIMAWDEAAHATSQVTGLRAVGSKDGSLTVEPRERGKAFVQPPSEPDRMIDLVCFSPDGRTLAAADNNRMYRGSVITIWDVSPSDENSPPIVIHRKTLQGLTHWTFAMDFFPDGRTLLYSNDRFVCISDVNSGNELARLVPHPHPKQSWDITADCVATSPDGQTFATWAWDSLKLWDRQSLRLLRVMDTGGGIGCKLAYTPDSRRLVATDREKVVQWDLRPSPLWFLFMLGSTLTAIGWCYFTCTRKPPCINLAGVTKGPDDTAATL